jgi:hypothetical protein
MYQTKEAATKIKCTSFAGCFDGNVDVEVRCGVHHPVEHIPGFSRGHWMSPWGECMRHITPTAAMVNNFVAKHQNRKKNYF